MLNNLQRKIDQYDNKECKTVKTAHALLAEVKPLEIQYKSRASDVTIVYPEEEKMMTSSSFFK